MGITVAPLQDFFSDRYQLINLHRYRLIEPRAIQIRFKLQRPHAPAAKVAQAFNGAEARKIPPLLSQPGIQQSVTELLGE